MNPPPLESSRDEASSVAILVAAGKGARAGAGELKQFRRLGGVPLLARAVRPFVQSMKFERLILVVPDPVEAEARLRGYLDESCPLEFVAGGATRQASTTAGLAAVPSAEIVLVHDGARPFVDVALILRVWEAARRHGAAVPVVPVHETLKSVDPQGRITGTANRAAFALAQTPQGFRREVLRAALERASSENFIGTDEAEIVERAGHPVTRVEGQAGNLKLTTPGDFAWAEKIVEARRDEEGYRIGVGYDVHPLVPGRPLVLGGVSIPHPAGPAGHSDGDLVCHAATDALLGAAGLPDIGQIFPDTDPSHRGAASLELLERAGRMVRQQGCRLINLDLVVVAEEPRLVPHLQAMRENLARALQCEPGCLGIKGKRGEGLGFEGRREGMSAHAVALVRRGVSRES